MRRFILVLLLGVLLLGSTAVGQPVDDPHMALRVGAVGGLIPVFNGTLQLGATYATEAVEVTAESLFTILPDFHFFQRLGVAFFPGEMKVGAVAGFTIDPFFLAEANVWAETTIQESYIGDSDTFFTGVAGAEIRLGGVLGGRFFYRAIADFPGKVNVLATSITSVVYDEMRGLGVEEEIDLRARFEAPGFFGGQLLTEDDLSSLTAYTTVRAAYGSNGFALAGIVFGLEIEFVRPLGAN